MPRKSPAWDISLTDEKKETLAAELCRDIEDALTARAKVISDGGLIDLYDWFYEQGQSKPEDRPIRGGADLTSFIFTENIDAMRSRMMQAVFRVEPFCIVDGWGADAKKAPLVEAFHEWQVDEEGLEEELGKVAHGALIEDAYVLEVRERIETRRLTETIDAALELNEQGGAIWEDGKPRLVLDDDGEPVPAQAGQPSAKIEVTRTKTKRLGPEYDTISMKDFVFLPGHAKNQRQVYGYAYRLWKRVPEIQELAKDKIYDPKAVDAMGDTSDRQDAAVPPTVDGVATQYGPAVEKELWQLSLKRDLDGDGREEWYLITLSLKHRQILRCNLDKFVMRVGKPRCVPFVLFPRRNSVYGYAYAGDKLLTLAEEHTALRNMAADRSALATNAPITQVSGGLWDPDAQPLGVGQVIPVRSHDEVKQMQIADVPQSVIYLLRDVMAAKERVGGLADTSVGVQSSEKRTLGENQLVATGSAVRVEEPLGYFRRAIEHVMQLRHAIWIDTLEADSKGIEAPAGVVDRLSTSGVQLQNGRFTADQLKGRFRFKPYGSVDTADATTRMQYFMQAGQTLVQMANAFPMMRQIFASPEVAVRMVQEWARVYKIRDVNVFLKALQQPPVPLPMAGGMTPADPMAATATGAAPAGLAAPPAPLALPPMPAIPDAQPPLPDVQSMLNAFLESATTAPTPEVNGFVNY